MFAQGRAIKDDPTHGPVAKVFSLLLKNVDDDESSDLGIVGTVQIAN